jgi:glycolate dehydrogenase FAD-binding subunit
MDLWRCADVEEAREAIAWAAVEPTPLRIQGRGTKLSLGRPVAAQKCLDLSALAGIVTYEPEELILIARAGTRLAEIDAVLAGSGQMLGFEPRDLGPLLGAPEGEASLGGIVSTTLSGPRRFAAGAVRDAVLGLTAINGRGEIFKSGGRVMKNVSGYDLPKLLTGAYGTLGVLTEIVLKVHPRPETEETVILAGLDDKAAIGALRMALDTPAEISGAAHLPEPAARASRIAPLAALGAPLTALRLEGTREGVGRRREALLALLRRPGFHLGPLAERGGALLLDETDSAALWREIRDVGFFCGRPGPVWRISSAPMSGPLIAAAAGAESWFYDWAGGLIWLLMDEDPHGGEPLIRRAVDIAGGHATLMRGDEGLRQRAQVFAPQETALAELTKRVKDAFDPAHILNPGLMYPEV